MIGKDFKQEHGEKFYTILPTSYEPTYRLGTIFDGAHETGTRFAEFEHVFEHTFVDGSIYSRIGELEICDDSKIYAEPNNKYVADKCFITQISSLAKFFDTATLEQRIQAVKQNGNILKVINNAMQTPEICEIALKQNPDLFEYAYYKPLELSLKLIKKAPTTISKIENQTPEMCMAAVKKNGRMIRYVKNQTPELCMAAVKQNGLALDFIKNQTPELCMEAVQQDDNAVQFIDKKIIKQMFEYFRFNQIHF